MKWIFGFLVCFVLKSCGAQDSAKNASVLCFKDETTNTFKMTLTVMLNTDPPGALWAINNTDYEMNPFMITQLPTGCSSTYDANTKIYRAESVVDLSSTSNAQDSNVCSRVRKTAGVSSTYWEWLFMHVTSPPNPNQMLLIEARDRVYKVSCSMANLTSNILTSHINVSTPNLNQNVNPSRLLVSLKVQKKNNVTLQYSDVTVNDVVRAGTIIRLMAVYDRTANYNDNLNVHSISMYNTIVSPFVNFASQTYTIINELGCANVNGQNMISAPLRPTRGFRGSLSGNLFVLTTGDFYAWKMKTSNTLSFQTYFKTCFSGSTLLCQDACLANTGVSEPTGTLGRKRRQASDDEQPGVATVVIYVSDSDEGVVKTAENSSETNTMVVVGVTVGVAVVLIAALLVCMVAVIRKGNMEKKQHNSNLPVVIHDYSHKY